MPSFMLEPVAKYGVIILICIGVVWFISKAAINRYKRKEAERHAKIRDKQLEAERNKPGGVVDLAERLRNKGF